MEDYFSTFIFPFLRLYQFCLFIFNFYVMFSLSLSGINSLHTKRRLADYVVHSYNLCSEFEARLGYIARPWLTKPKQKGLKFFLYKARYYISSPWPLIQLTVACQQTQKVHCESELTWLCLDKTLFINTDPAPGLVAYISLLEDLCLQPQHHMCWKWDSARGCHLTDRNLKPGVCIPSQESPLLCKLLNLPRNLQPQKRASIERE